MNPSQIKMTVVNTKKPWTIIVRVHILSQELFNLNWRKIYDKSGIQTSDLLIFKEH
jgi:hypothetical protein